jgi:hypothetical protein
MKKIKYLLFPVIILLCVSVVPAQTTGSVGNQVGNSNNSISGVIFGASNRPVADVYVELQNQFGSTLTRTRTNGSGHYSFRRLSEGIYKIKVLTFGTNYLEAVKPVSLISIGARPGSGGASEQVDFQLILNRKFSSPLAAPGVIFAQSVPREAEKLYEEGVNLLGDGKEKEGFDKLIKAIEAFPDYYAAYERLGNEYVVRKINRPAYVLLSEALRINPKSYEANYGLGITQYRLGLYDDALKSLESAIKIYGDAYGPHLWVSMVYEQKGKLTEAEAALEKANNLSDKKSADVHFQFASIYAKQKRYEEAALSLEQYLKYAGDIPNEDKIKETIAELRSKKQT